MGDDGRIIRILVCGSRHWTDYKAIVRQLRPYAPHCIVIHGAARGADSLAGRAADALGMSVEDYPADWSAYGRRAGVLRNQRMLDEGKPDLVFAFTPDMERSRGTRDMVTRARKQGVRVFVYGDAYA